MKPNVLQLIGSLHQGGSERQAVQLCKLLHETGRYNVYVACLDPQGLLRNEIEALGIKTIPAFPLTSFYDRNVLIQVRRFASYLRRHRIDVVQTHDFYTNIFGMIASAIAGIPVRIAARRESAKRPSSHRRIERLAYGLSHAVVANCNEVRRQLIHEGVTPHKIVTIYNGLHSFRIQPVTCRRADSLALLNLSAWHSCPLVTIVANMRQSAKNIPMFLRAARLVQQSIPQTGFLLAGEGPMLDEFRGLAEQIGIVQRTVFLGRCDAIAELLSVSDVCVLSSRSEGFSNSILEYMAAGRPVVATDVGGAREVIIPGKTGYLVPSEDDQAMGENIVTLLQNPDKAQEMGLCGRQVVESRFSTNIQLQNVEDLYVRLMQHTFMESRDARPEII